MTEADTSRLQHRSGLPADCLYLVTDSDLLYKSAISLEDHVEQAILGGVNVVQLREKEASTRDFVIKAKKLKEICQKHKVPLVINDRIDIALAVGADGVHIGQDDMSCTLARKLLGPNVFIGVSVNNLEETKQAVEDGADYVGIGAVYDTQTKALTKPTMGPSGVRDILRYLSTVERYIGAVAIGGLNAENIQRVMYDSCARDRRLDGMALVSAIMTSSEPERTARGLFGLMTSLPPYAEPQSSIHPEPIDMPALISNIRTKRPLIQHMTNNVVKNFSANVCIAVGGSPAMSEVRDEIHDFARANGALLINMGTLTPDHIDTSIAAIQANNKLGRPVLFDPVGAGATTFRRNAAKRYLDNAHFDVIKGNEGEIRATAGLSSDQRGVDNVSSSSIHERCKLAMGLAQEWRNIVVVTGVEDVISNGHECIVVRSGHAWLGEVTGSGCSLGSVIATCMAANTGDKFRATIAAVALYGIAAEMAAAQDHVKGPGSFIPAFIDALYELSSDTRLLAAAIEARTNLFMHENP